MKPDIHKVKVGQIYKSRYSGIQVQISGRKGDKWLTKVLTAKPGVYKGSHTLSLLSIRQRFELMP